MEPGTVITITFEDHGQDFLEWDICNNVVIDCRPFQASVWVNCRLLEPMEALQVGHRPLIQSNYAAIGVLRVRYPLTGFCVQSDGRAEIPCCICTEYFPVSLTLFNEITNREGTITPFIACICPICAAEVQE